METIFVNIEKRRVTVNGESCNFIEAGLAPNGKAVTNRDEIEEHLTDCENGEDIEVIFE